MPENKNLTKLIVACGGRRATGGLASLGGFPKLQFWLSLNDLGRNKCCDPKFTDKDWYEALVKCNRKTDGLKYMYGLIRSNPAAFATLALNALNPPAPPAPPAQPEAEVEAPIAPLEAKKRKRSISI